MWLLQVSNFWKAIAGGVNINLYGSQSINPCVCAVSLYVCVISSHGLLVKNHNMHQTLVNLMPCCIKHTARILWYQGPALVDP